MSKNTLLCQVSWLPPLCTRHYLRAGLWGCRLSRRQMHLWCSSCCRSWCKSHYGTMQYMGWASHVQHRSCSTGILLAESGVSVEPGLMVAFLKLPWLAQLRVLELVGRKKRKNVSIYCCAIQQPRMVAILRCTFIAVYSPRWWIRRIRKSHVIFCIDSEVIFSTWLYGGSVGCTEKVVSYCAPNAAVGVLFFHHVVKSVISVMVWRWQPSDNNFTKNQLF